MKTEETKLAEEGNENEPENVNGKVNESVNPETQEKQKSSAKKNVAFTAGGVVAGAGSAVAGQFASAYLESDAEESTHTFEHTGTSVAPEAHVSDDLSFGEAFAAARAEVGPGGTFEWHGKEYGTYYKDEWDNMDPGERDQYWASVGLKPHPTDDNQITDQPDANTELLAQEDLEVDGIPEFDESEVDVVALGGEDILDSHDIPVDEVEMSDGEEVLYVDVEEDGDGFIETTVSEIPEDEIIPEEEPVFEGDGNAEGSVDNSYDNVFFAGNNNPADTYIDNSTNEYLV